jgi:hypothetical protein
MAERGKFLNADLDALADNAENLERVLLHPPGAVRQTDTQTHRHTDRHTDTQALTYPSQFGG